MRVVLFFILLFSSADLFAQNPQINPSADTKDMTITIHCPRLQNQTQAQNMKVILESFNSDKITSVNFNLGQKTFYLTITTQFNKVETLGLFREQGLESFYIENGMLKRLNHVGSELIEIPYTNEQ